jgi:tRNA 2-thiouridine synthesizing protein A
MRQTHTLNRMTDPTDEDDSHPLRELERLAGGRCRDCDRPFTAREAAGSIVLGFKDAPRCLPCLARGLGREPAGLRADLVAYARRRECCARAWAAAETIDGSSPDWPGLADANGERMSETASPRPDDPTLAPAADWDAGDMGCGELVLALRGRLNALPSGAVLKVTATDPAAPEDLPAWCRLTGNLLVRMNHPEYHIRRKER